MKSVYANQLSIHKVSYIEFSVKSIDKSKKIQFEDTVDIEKIMNKITEKIHKSKFYI